MRRGVRVHGEIAEAFVEVGSANRVRAKSEPYVTELGTGFKLCDQLSTQANAAYIGSHVEMPKTTDLRVIHIRVGRHTADRHQLVASPDAKEKLARLVQLNTTGRVVVEKPIHESK